MPRQRARLDAVGGALAEGDVSVVERGDQGRHVGRIARSVTVEKRNSFVDVARGPCIQRVLDAGAACAPVPATALLDHDCARCRRDRARVVP